mmetsp:Transcript_39718/g.60876  ORF Transcript_39718/g.60876 Transcript_39718/m.60876 type:complete len:162 (-) Transcript_39718:1426-1911(-)
MSNIYINRNRSQGDYARPADPPPAEKKPDSVFHTTNQLWLNRARVERDQVAVNEKKFFETSLKYQKKPDLNDKYVGVPWTIVDTCKLIKNNKRPPPQKGNDETLRWKSFNEYETMNPHEKYRHMIKESLKHEINNIVVDLALKREKDAFMNSPFLSPSSTN